MLHISCITHPCSRGCNVPEFWQVAILDGSLLLGNSHIELLHPSLSSLNVHIILGWSHSQLQEVDALTKLMVFL
jgi:hypothetical protein